jgi:site-specific DNA-methyltransferase (adenine-specific)
LGRRYTGFELSEKYLDIARQKHEQLEDGLDPFDKTSESISPPSSETTEYKIPKRDLQLEVKRIAEKLNIIPDKEDVEEHSRYALKYYEEYFDGWADVTKAARTTGMSEERDETDPQSTLYNYTE